MKKLLVLLLLCMMLLGILPTAVAEEPYHIVMCYVGNEQPDMSKVVAAINELTLKELNMTFELVQLGWGDYQQKQQLMLAGGDELDILPVFFSDASSYVNNGYLVDMSGLITQYGQGITDFMGDTATTGTINGFLYGIPANKESGSQSGFVMRKDIVDKYEIDVAAIKTYDDMTAVFEKIHAGEPTMNLLVGQNIIAQVESWDVLSDRFGALENAGQSTNVVNLFETDEFVRRANIVR